jgi:MoxR-like ATPase
MTRLAELRDAVAGEVRKVIVGQEAALDVFLAALSVGGHVLLEGVPGVGKTLLADATARALGLDFRRMQFTPDMLPSDITGTMTLLGGELTFRRGPVFTNLLLADEVNRTPPKTQAALLEAMQERQVSVEGTPRPLPDPFLVVATQNPIEYEGTYPLPEAQLDRFLLQVNVGYPKAADERRILNMHNSGANPHDLESLGITAVATAADVQAAAALATKVTVSDEVIDYIQRLAEATRSSPSTSLGVSPRGAAMLLTVCKSAAWLGGRDFVTPDDVKTLIGPAWRHRVLLRPEVEMEGGRADAVLEGITERVGAPR